MRGRLAGVLRLLAGSGISLSPSWGGGEVTVTNSQPGHVIQDEGVSLTQRSKLNFVGSVVTATDDATNDATRVSIVPWKTLNLRIENDTAAPTNKVVVRADEITIEDVLISSVNVTLDITLTGAGGRDGGTEAANTWYAIWLIYNPSTGAVSGLLSTSFTSPVMPSGYTKKRRVGAVRNNANSDFLGFLQLGDKVEWNETTATTHAIVSGGTATTFTTVSAAAYMPPTSRRALAVAFTSVVAEARARITGTSVTNGRVLASGVANATLGLVEIDTNTSQQFDYKVDTGAVTIVSMGYYDPIL